MNGTILKRGKHSYRVKFEISPDPVTGKRRYHQETVRGSRADAVTLLAKRLTERGEGMLVTKVSITVGEYAQHWLSAVAPTRRSRKTRERDGELIRGHIVPRIGSVALQKLDAPAIDALYAHLRAHGRLDGKGGLSEQTIRHIHKLLSLILNSAVKTKKLRASPVRDVETAPRVVRPEIAVLDQKQLSTLLHHLKGGPLFMPVLLAASTGMRRSELLGLPWRCVDLSKGTVEVAEVAELVGGKVFLKAPKTARSRRTIDLPEQCVAELSRHRAEQAQHCLRLGCSRFALVFPTWDGKLDNPNNFSRRFADAASAAGVEVTFHGLRHTHITQLLRASVPVHVVSARAGHASAKQTLDTYAHLLPGQQGQAAAVFDATLREILK